MNREDIMRMAKEVWSAGYVHERSLERFAALVAAHVKASDGAITNEGTKVDVHPVAWIKKDRSSVEVSIMSSEYMVNLGFEPLYTHPPAADVAELLNFVEEYIYAYESGMADDSYLLRIAKAAIAKATGAKV